MDNPINTTVLIVEDNAVISHLNQRILTRSGYGIITARNGKVAWEMIESKSTPIDLAVIDLDMPIMNGFELLERIRKHPEHKSLPVIVLTASYQPEDKVQSIDLGANLYITKPVGTKELRFAVKKLLDSRASVG